MIKVESKKMSYAETDYGSGAFKYCSVEQLYKQATVE
jgi:hypothetical protein